YDDGAQNLFLYTRGKTGIISQELKELLQYFESTTWKNAVNKPLREVQSMVDNIKHNKEVSISYMKSYERDQMIRNEGRTDGLSDAVRDLLSDLGAIPENIAVQIDAEKDLDTLRRWLRAASKAKSIEEFARQMS
ncbi:MAG: hypothetical protein K2O13_10340, partial [Lachnospiraceae bacterium]|nr:hypothetical protein [Lachnospiraceae bacterium]